MPLVYLQVGQERPAGCSGRGLHHCHAVPGVTGTCRDRVRPVVPTCGCLLTSASMITPAFPPPRGSDVLLMLSSMSSACSMLAVLPDEWEQGAELKLDTAARR